MIGDMARQNPSGGVRGMAEAAVSGGQPGAAPSVAEPQRIYACWRAASRLSMGRSRLLDDSSLRKPLPLARGTLARIPRGMRPAKRG